MIANLKTKDLAALLGAVALVMVLIVYFVKEGVIFTDDAYLKSDITVIKPKVSGYLTEILVNDHQRVNRGQVLAKIDDRDYKLKVDLAQANVDAALASIASLNEKIKIQEIEVKNSNLKQNSAKISLGVASKELKRAEFLIKDRSVSQQDVDKKRELENNLKNEYSASVENTYASELRLQVIQIELNQAKALLQMHKANYELAKLDLEHASIKAPANGIISRKSLQMGQYVNSNIALGFLVQDGIWVLANYKETQINQMKIGQRVKIEVDSVSGVTFKGKVDSFSPATGSEFSILPPENATGNFTKIVQRVPVKIVFDDNQDLSPLKSGLSCEVKVYISE